MNEKLKAFCEENCTMCVYEERFEIELNKKDQQIYELKEKLVEEKQKHEEHIIRQSNENERVRKKLAVAERALEIGHDRYSGLNPLYLKNKAQKELGAEE